MTETSSLEAIASGIDAAIEATGGKQSFLADKLGCAQQTVSKLRSGEIPMTADWALRIEVATDQLVPAGIFVPSLAHRQSEVAHSDVGAS